ncbi:10786_t:CDS:1, partial [Funneliformis caledonium]
VRNLYNDWMCNAIKDYTPSEKIKRPSYLLVANWVKEGWNAVDINKIRQSFKCCGILNAADRTEDTLIFDFNQLEDRVNREDLGREVDLKREVEKDNEGNDEDSDEDSNYNENESELEDSNEIELEDSDESELEDNYYKKNEEQNVIQD